MRIGLIVVAYGLAEDLVLLFSRSDSSKVHWYLFLHSQVEEVVAVCERLAARPNVRYYPYGENRGLAKSWNEGLIDGYHDGMDVMLIANDDAAPQYGDATRIARAAARNRDYYMVSGWGFDARALQSGDMLFSLAAINPVALEKIGYFDENFYPIYYEDRDYYRRAQLAGLGHMCIPSTHILHAGSKSRSIVPIQQHEEQFERNKAYYLRKWGGEKEYELFETPFNDPALGWKIRTNERNAPYPGYNRMDREAAG